MDMTIGMVTASDEEGRALRCFVMDGTTFNAVVFERVGSKWRVAYGIVDAIAENPRRIELPACFEPPYEVMDVLHGIVSLHNAEVDVERVDEFLAEVLDDEAR